MRVEQLDLGAAFAPPGGSLQDAPLLKLDAIRKCSGHRVVFDTETNGLFWHQGHHPIGLALYCPAADVAGYIPFFDSNDIRYAAQEMANWSPETIVIGHNLKFDMHQMGLRPRSMPWRMYDTMNMAHLLDSRGAPNADGSWFDVKEERGRMDLNSLCRYYLDDESKAEHVKQFKGRKVWELPLRLLSRYAAEDARLTYELAEELGKRLRSRGQLPLLERIMRFMGVIWDTERTGLQLDLQYIADVDTLVTSQLEELQAQLFAEPRIGGEFDWRNANVLSRVLYDQYGWPRPVNPFSEETRFKTQYTKTATSAFLLVEKAQHPLGTLILQLRGLDRLLQFTEQWRNLMDGDGAVHPSFTSAFVRTGRLSARDPNTQQLPSDARSSLLTNVFEDADALMEFFAQTNLRKAFVARPGKTLLGVDYKQQEIRLFAALSQDPGLLEAITSGQDVHSAIAKQIWGHGEDPWRDWAKVVSFGMLYGMTVGSLEFRLNKTRDEAYQIMAQYHRAFPRVKGWMGDVLESMRTAGFVTYWSGRRYYRDDPEYQYKAVNALVQGGAADLMMEACIEIADWFEKDGIPAKIVNYVHDEVDLEIDTDVLPEVVDEICTRMEVPHLMGLPFLTDAKAGPNLGELKKLG